jgi:ATP-dependent metalloprotease
MVNIAALNAVRNNRAAAGHTDFEYALDRITMGIGKTSMIISEKDKMMTAVHEGGHTLVNLLLGKEKVGSVMPLHKVTILPRGGALGYTAMMPERDYVS